MGPKLSLLRKNGGLEKKWTVLNLVQDFPSLVELWAQIYKYLENRFSRNPF